LPHIARGFDEAIDNAMGFFVVRRTIIGHGSLASRLTAIDFRNPHATDAVGQTPISIVGSSDCADAIRFLSCSRLGCPATNRLVDGIEVERHDDNAKGRL
jgi:hypothetical protein